MLTKQKKIRVFDSIDSLSIWHYNKITDTGDLTYLLKDRSDKAVPDYLESVWSKIITERLNATAHREEMKRVFDLQVHIFELMADYNHLQTLCFAAERFFDEYAPQLEAEGYQIDKPEDLKKVSKQINRLLTQRREVEFTLANELNKGGEVSFARVFDRICDHKGMRMNHKKITVAEWIAIEDNYLIDINKKLAHASN